MRISVVFLLSLSAIIPIVNAAGFLDCFEHDECRLNVCDSFADTLCGGDLGVIDEDGNIQTNLVCYQLQQDPWYECKPVNNNSGEEDEESEEEDPSSAGSDSSEDVDVTDLSDIVSQVESAHYDEVKIVDSEEFDINYNSGEEEMVVDVTIKDEGLSKQVNCSDINNELDTESDQFTNNGQNDTTVNCEELENYEIDIELKNSQEDIEETFEVDITVSKQENISVTMVDSNNSTKNATYEGDIDVVKIDYRNNSSGSNIDNIGIKLDLNKDEGNFTDLVIEDVDIDIDVVGQNGNITEFDDIDISIDNFGTDNEDIDVSMKFEETTENTNASTTSSSSSSSGDDENTNTTIYADDSNTTTTAMDDLIQKHMDEFYGNDTSINTGTIITGNTNTTTTNGMDEYIQGHMDEFYGNDTSINTGNTIITGNTNTNTTTNNGMDEYIQGHMDEFYGNDTTTAVAGNNTGSNTGSTTTAMDEIIQAHMDEFYGNDTTTAAGNNTGSNTGSNTTAMDEIIQAHMDEFYGDNTGNATNTSTTDETTDGESSADGEEAVTTDGEESASSDGEDNDGENQSDDDDGEDGEDGDEELVVVGLGGGGGGGGNNIQEGEQGENTFMDLEKEALDMEAEENGIYEEGGVIMGGTMGSDGQGMDVELPTTKEEVVAIPPGKEGLLPSGEDVVEDESEEENEGW